MSIETTYTVKRGHAFEMLDAKGISVPANGNNEWLAELLYDNRESEFENYRVVYDGVNIEDEQFVKTHW